jgi:hypothetical protein
LQLVFRHLPRDQRTRREVGRHQRLAHAPDCSGLQHRAHAFDNDWFFHAGKPRYFAKWIEMKTLNAIFRNRQNARV